MITKSKYMELALEQAKIAADNSEVPVGAIIIDVNGQVIAKAYNLVEANNDPTAHAEILAIRQAAQILQTPRLVGCKLYVTLEPCPCCAQAISFARIAAVYYGASDVKGGGVENGARIFNASSCHHKPEIYSGIYEQECSDILKKFFLDRR